MWSHRLILATVYLCITCPPIFAQSAGDNDDRTKAILVENQRLRQELVEARTRIAALRQQLEAATRQNTALAQDKSDLQIEKTRLEQLAGMTSKGEAIQSAIARIKGTYDSSSDRTIVASSPLKPLSQTSNVNAEHHFTFEYEHAGQKLTGDPSAIRLILAAYFRPNTKYGAQKVVTLILDGERLGLPVSGYETIGTSRTPSPLGTMTRYNERIAVALTPDQLRAIALASEASVEFAGNLMQMPREFAATAGAMRERIKLRQ